MAWLIAWARRGAALLRCREMDFASAKNTACALRSAICSPCKSAERASAATWIYSIARNLRIDLARQSVRSNNLPDDLWEPDPETPADQTLIEAQSAHAVTQLLSQLPEAQLQILRLSYYENLSHSEIARNLSLPLGTVKSRLRLALAVLKGLLSSPKGRS